MDDDGKFEHDLCKELDAFDELVTAAEVVDELGEEGETNTHAAVIAAESDLITGVFDKHIDVRILASRIAGMKTESEHNALHGAIEGLLSALVELYNGATTFTKKVLELRLLDSFNKTLASLKEFLTHTKVLPDLDHSGDFGVRLQELTDAVAAYDRAWETRLSQFAELEFPNTACIELPEVAGDEVHSLLYSLTSKERNALMIGQDVHKPDFAIFHVKCLGDIVIPHAKAIDCNGEVVNRPGIHQQYKEKKAVIEFEGAHEGYIGGSKVGNLTIDSTNITFPQKKAHFSGCVEVCGSLIFDDDEAEICVPSVKTDCIEISNHMTCKSMSLTSDRRLKENIKDLNVDKLMDDVATIEAKEYNFITKSSEKRWGFIAQDVPTSLSNLVEGEVSETSYLSINYMELLALVPALCKKIRDLEKRIN